MALQPTFSSDLFTAVTPSDTALLVNPDTNDTSGKCRMLQAVTAGTITVKNRFGTTVLLGTFAAGQQIVVATDRVMSTGTTATVVAYF